MISGDLAELAKFHQKYEVESVQNLMQSKDAIPQAVRVLEFFYPAGAFRGMDPSEIYPLLEPQRRFVAPLLALADKGDIVVHAFEPSAVHQVSTEVFVLAGKQDEAVDYRTSIALSYSYPHHCLFIANDNHVFSKLTAADAEGSLLQTFLGFGINSKELSNVLKRDQQFRWTE